MKMKEAHVVPLSRQAVALLEHVKLVTGYGNLFFPSPHDSGRGLSDVTLTAALRRLGYGVGEMTIHGFRATASTLLNELGFHPDLIELQLARKEVPAFGLRQAQDARIATLEAAENRRAVWPYSWVGPQPGTASAR